MQVQFLKLYINEPQVARSSRPQPLKDRLLSKFTLPCEYQLVVIMSMTSSNERSFRHESIRKIALAAGMLYLLTFVSIPTLVLYGPVKGANYVLGAGPDTAAIIGGVLEIIVALAGIGTAVVLFPVLKKQNEAAALGLVAAREFWNPAPSSSASRSSCRS